MAIDFTLPVLERLGGGTKMLTFLMGLMFEGLIVCRKSDQQVWGLYLGQHGLYSRETYIRGRIIFEVGLHSGRYPHKAIWNYLPLYYAYRV